MSTRPAATPVGSRTPEPLTDDEILAAVKGEIPPRPTPFGYRAALLLVAVVLVLLPLAYLGLLAFVGWLIYRQIGTVVRGEGGGPFGLIPVALGIVVLLFLVKPLFARRRGDAEEVIALLPSQEPMLFRFVHRVCQLVGAPMPAQIEVDCTANAHARLRRGLLSIGNDDLVLRLGLPLAAGLTVRQFAGLLGHEFAHFTQRAGMSTTYLVRTMNVWIGRVCFGRDRFDLKLEQLRRSRNAFARLIYYVVAFFVESARGVLWLVFVSGELISRGVLRRMEFDADRYEAHLCGGEAFEKTGKILVFMDIARQVSQFHLGDSWEQRRLADDLPRFVVANVKELSAKLRADVPAKLKEQKTGWFDTHPCHADRVRAVDALGLDGTVACEAPARRVFGDFGELCRRSTAAYYRSVLKESFSPTNLVPTAELVDERVSLRRAFESLRRFFRDRVSPSRPIFPGVEAAEPPADPTRAAEGLPACRDRMLAMAARAGVALKAHRESVDAARNARARLALANVFGRARGLSRFRAKAEADLRTAEWKQSGAMQDLTAFEDVARTRLNAALQLLQAEVVTGALGGGGANLAAARTKAHRMIGVSGLLTAAVPAVEQIAQAGTTLHLLLRVYKPDRPGAGAVGNRILQVTRELARMVNQVRQELWDIPYPFRHADKSATIGSALTDQVPDDQNPAVTLRCAGQLVDRFQSLVLRSQAMLTDLAEQVESAIGLPPLDTPADEDDDAVRKAAREKKPTLRERLAYPARAVSGLAILGLLIALSMSSGSILPAWHMPTLRAALDRDDAPRSRPPGMRRPPPRPSAPRSSLAVPGGPEADEMMLVSQTRLMKIEQAIRNYRADHNREYPDSLQDLIGPDIPLVGGIETPAEEGKRFVYLGVHGVDGGAVLVYDPATYGGKPGPALLITGEVLTANGNEDLLRRKLIDAGVVVK